MIAEFARVPDRRDAAGNGIGHPGDGRVPIDAARKVEGTPADVVTQTELPAEAAADCVFVAAGRRQYSRAAWDVSSSPGEAVIRGKP